MGRLKCFAMLLLPCKNFKSVIALFVTHIKRNDTVQLRFNELLYNEDLYGS